MLRRLYFPLFIIASTFPTIAPAQEYDDRLGNWTIIGGSDLESCVLISDPSNGSRVSAFATGGRNELTFAVANVAWKKLSNGSMRLQALFLESHNRPLDYWSLDALGDNASDQTPAIRFTIDRSKNDGESFLENFRKSSSLVFAIDEVPLARFDLSGSAIAVDRLLECRAFLRAQPDFDPFAG